LPAVAKSPDAVRANAGIDRSVIAFQEYADLYAKKGNLIVRVTLPMGPKSVETAKSISRKALARM
jgi:hypothetical protein